MAVIKLSSDIQSLFNASTQIHSYKRAIEELVYNSLDADSTSIAIRVNIEQNTVQVIDNGHGVSKDNFSLIGLRHATSKCVDLSTLKSIPNKYGYKGQSLASIIEVSQSIKISSRCQDSENTWTKIFLKGKVHKLYQTLQRPSKGTTVELEGFLYNLKIQKKAVDPLSELNDIKKFLEQLSLVHNNISLSLRDDAKNEIIFKLHKNRDIYQTLSSIFDIGISDIQELKVEKNQYKVTAYIGKNDKESIQKHWLYLNGKLLQNSKLQTVVNDTLIKSLKLNIQSKRKVKLRRDYHQDEDVLDKSGLPFYFIFVNCPYYDYDISYKSKNTIVEFKDWEPITKLIEKMAMFYVGDINLKQTKPVTKQTENEQKADATGDQVKKIMDKILGSNPKKIGVSQMQNGVKGKVTKRKTRKKVNRISIPTILPPSRKPTKENEKTVKQLKINNDSTHHDINIPADRKTNEAHASKTTLKKQKMNMKNRDGIINNKNLEYEIPPETKESKTKHNNKDIANKNKTKRKEIKIQGTNKITTPTFIKKPQHLKPKLNNKQYLNKPNTKKLHKLKHCNQNKIKINSKMADKKFKLDPLLKSFKDDPNGSIQRRCNVLRQKVDDLMGYIKKRKRKIFINETVQYSNIITHGNKNYSVRKKIDEIVVHNYIPKRPSLNPCTFNERISDSNKKEDFKSSYDLVQTVLQTQGNSYSNEINIPFDVSPETFHSIYNCPEKKNPWPGYKKLDDAENIPSLPKLTFESHNYAKRSSLISHKYNEENEMIQSSNEQAGNARFITTQSKENFVIPTVKPKPARKLRSILNKVKGFQNRVTEFFTNDESYTIEFSNSNIKDKLCEKNQEEDVMSYNCWKTKKYDKTYTFATNCEISATISSQTFHAYTINGPSQNRDMSYNINHFTEDNDDIEFIEDSTEKLPQNDQKHQETFLLSKQNYNQQHNVNNNNVFISKTQDRQDVIDVIDDIRGLDPMNICETVHSPEAIKEDEVNGREWNNSLFNEDFDIDSYLCDRNAYTQGYMHEPMDAGDISMPQTTSNQNRLGARANSAEERKMSFASYFLDRSSQSIESAKNLKQNENNFTDNKSQNFTKGLTDGIHFNFQNRHRFIPKGMSPIFANCRSKNVCDYNLENDYFEETIYNEFVNNVQINTEIFESKIQNVKDFTTKPIEKVNNKLNKDNASLIFNGESLKHAKVLQQIDHKFIAAKIIGKTHKLTEMLEYLVLFDQHAVHERIRLENNLSDYFDGNQWKSTSLDNIAIKLTKDEILYLHNYKEKFDQLGMQWTISDDGNVTINAIPKALLGKNPRQVEIVIKAAKSLIVEEINAIKTQSGCISLYPRTIMNLVFSEACRYAIKFGDPLSKTDCVDLLSSLSKCKTPFQCAHGRPVMAVLMETKSEKMYTYKANMTSIQMWKKKYYKK